MMPISANGVDMNLLGHAYKESSGFADFPTNTTASVPYLTVGDFSKGFIIFDRLNSATIEPVNHLFDTATGRPTGNRGALFLWRVGSDLANPSGSGETGFRVLVNKTT